MKQLFTLFIVSLCLLPINSSAATLDPNSDDWSLVRRVSQSSATWHPATDSLAGTDVYGTAGCATCDVTFSLNFENAVSNWDQILLATGDMSHWMIFERNQLSITGANTPMTIFASSISTIAYDVLFYNRDSIYAEDPWLSLNDHGYMGRTASFDDEVHSMLYGENAFSGWDFWRENHLGANVFIRDSTLSPVPVPAAAWLFGSALLGFLGYSRRRKSKA